MAKTMRAFVMKGLNEVGLVEKPLIEDPGPIGAIVKTTRALVCTSDCHTVHGAIGERHNLTLGHEAVGIVHKLGCAGEGCEGRRPRRGQRDHAVLQVRQLRARLHLAVPGDARRLEVRQHQGRRVRANTFTSTTPRRTSRQFSTQCPTRRPCTRAT